MNDSKIEYAYSSDQEHYHLDSKYALDDAAQHIEEGQEQVTIYKGPAKIAKHSDFICGVSIIEDMQNCAMDNYGEWSEDYLMDLSNDKAEELEKLIVKWLEENAEKPTFYTVGEIEEETHPVD